LTIVLRLATVRLLEERHLVVPVGERLAHLGDLAYLERLQNVDARRPFTRKRVRARTRDLAP